MIYQHFEETVSRFWELYLANVERRYYSISVHVQIWIYEYIYILGVEHFFVFLQEIDMRVFLGSLPKSTWCIF